MPTLIDWLTRYANTTDDQQRWGMALFAPGLLSLEFLDAQEKRLPAGAPERTAIGDLRSMIAGLKNGTVPYLVDMGPVDRLMAAVGRGEITPETALRQASEIEVAQHLSRPYVMTQLRQIFDQRFECDVRDLLLRIRLLRAGLCTRSDSPDTLESRRAADEDFLKIAQQYLWQWADGRVLREAVEIGERLLAAADHASDPTLYRRHIFHLLGTLHLDPYAAARPQGGYLSTIQGWQHRFIDANRETLARLPPDQWKMPPASAALATAEKYLREAASLETGQAKGESLKALAQAVQWGVVARQLETHGEGPIDASLNRDSEVIAIAREALRHLEFSRGAKKILGLLATLSGLGEKVEVAQVAPIFDVPPDEYFRRMGIQQTHDLLQASISILLSADLDQALSFIHDLHPLYEVHPYEAGYNSLLTLELEGMMCRGRWSMPKDSSADTLKQEAEALLKQTRAGGPDVGQALGKLIAIINATGMFNEEVWGIRLLDAVESIAPVFAKRHEQALQQLRAQQLCGAGVNAFSSKEFDVALIAYAMAARQCLDLKQPQRALQLVGRMRDCVEKSATPMIDALSQGLALIARPLFQQTGDDGRQQVLQACREAIAQKGSHLSTKVFRVLQFAKGFEFSAALVVGAAGLRAASPRRTELLALIATAEQRLRDEPLAPPADPGPVPDTLARELQLVAFNASTEAHAGSDTPTRLANLRRAYDTQLNAELLTTGGDETGLVLGIEEVQAALDVRTVLASFYLGKDDQGRVATQVLLISRERITGVRISQQFPASTLRAETNGIDLSMDPLGLFVAGVRERLQLPSGPLPFDQAATHDLASGIPMFFGNDAELEKFQKEGKDHLCIVPHGALHYYPFHLLNYQGGALADRWAVSVLQNLNLLVASRGRPALRWERGQPLVSVGLSYQDPLLNPWGLPPLADATKEAQEVADIFGVVPLLDAHATEENVAAAMTRARYVHLSMHGRQDANAPAFHCMYAAPGAASDGRIDAHEVLQWDLRGVDLITLSACETGLGRFDVADNLRGLPASFLIAGVSTLVGTFWQVKAATARFFFIHLYQELQKRHSRIDAFWSAQRETKKQFRRYADWGAFYLAGDWT